ncbi:MAG: amidohydrolase family protein [Methanomicrobiales archaeon]|nr:amidohydrolase family protein [Methanomicrobiales archaeon]
MLDLILKNVTLPQGGRTDISVKKGLVNHAGASGRAHETIDCTTMICLPGGVDMHVHMRDGVQSQKETWKSGSMSALAGGVTVVVDQPNTDPPLLTPERYRARVEEAMRASCCHFAINAGAVLGTDLEALWRAGAMAFGEIFTSPSTSSEPVPYRQLIGILQNIGNLGATATLHAEAAPDRPALSLEEHDILRSIDRETELVRSIERSVKEVRLHFCHLSAPHAIDTALSSFEVTPHHLFLSLEHFDGNDARGKVNPPLRKEIVRRELWSRWDHIPVIASDHAPHTMSEKQTSFDKAPAGIPGVETMLPLLVYSALKGDITLSSIAEKTSYTPARILGIPLSGFSKGCRADFILFRPEVTVINAEHLHSRCGWTPFEGMQGIFPDSVIMDGIRVYDQGEFLEQRGRWYAGRGYIPS